MGHSIRRISRISPNIYQTTWRRSVRTVKPSLLQQRTQLQTTSTTLSIRAISIAGSSNYNNHYNQSYHSHKIARRRWIAAAIAVSAFGYSSTSIDTTTIHAEPPTRNRDPHPEWQAGNHMKNQPSITRKQVFEHKTADSLWLTYRHGVYDLTPFADEHPGAVERLLMGCQGDHDICGWWTQLGYHNVHDVHKLLEKYRIGNIADSDFVECPIEAARIDPVLRKARSALNDSAFSYEPFIAETPIDILNEHFYTPKEYHYVRNHFAVPMHLDWESSFTISGIGVPKAIVDDNDDFGEDDEGFSLQYKDLFELPMVTHDIYLQCGGHRRIEYNQFGTTKGSKWDVGAIGNAKYRGVLLRDVLTHIGVDVDALYNDHRDLHVWFVGADCAPDGEGYGVSIPVYKALAPRGDVMLAVEYNGEPLTRDHGFPVRVLVPGWVGARSVKWIENIIISDKQCDMKSYTTSYRLNKGFTQEMRDLPVNSSIQSPVDRQCIIVADDGVLTITGEAHSGGGKPIIRVDVSIDGGQTWNEGIILDQPQNLSKKKWSWTKWECKVDVNSLRERAKDGEDIEIEIVCRAMDLSHNRQPETCAADLTFNPKGYSANPYHRIRVQLSFD